MCVVRKTGPDLSVRVVSPRDEQVKNIRFEFERTWTIVGSFFDPSLNSSNVTVGETTRISISFSFVLTFQQRTFVRRQGTARDF